MIVLLGKRTDLSYLYHKEGDMNKVKGTVFPGVVTEGNTLSSVSDPHGNSLQQDCLAF